VEKPEQWEKIKEIVGAALEQERNRRPAFLDEACAHNQALRAEVESLLSAHAESDGLSEHPWASQLAGSDDGFKSIGPYRLIQKLGEGGMGQVWLAEQTEPVRRQVALKLIKAGIFDPSLLERFQSERQSLAIMDHPSIAKVFDAGATLAGQPYFAMEYVEGAPITDYCDQKKLGIRERLELFLRVCEGVQHAHQKAIIHRDLKPANILVVEMDGKPMPRIIDFGLAKTISSMVAGQPFVTEVGAFLGTPGYMSPEQVDPSVQGVDTRTDVYSLGVILYELLTGCLPFDTDRWKKLRLDEVLRHLREEDPPRPSTKVSTERNASAAEARSTERKQLIVLLRGDLDWITLKAVEKERDRRYATPSELSADIVRYLQNRPVAARPASRAYRIGKFARRNRTAVALTSVACIASVAGVVGTMMQARTARVQRDFALRQLSRAEAINDLNSFLLSDAAPSGKPFTVNELLGRAEHIVERQQDKHDPQRIQVLISLGRQYNVLDEQAKSRQLLIEAYGLSRELTDQSIRARASCALASALALAGEHPRAEKLAQEGLKELGNGPQFALDQMFCLFRGADVARERGDIQAQIERVQTAQRVLKQSPFESDLLESQLLMEVAASYRFAGRYEEASAAFGQASARLTALGRDDTQTAVTLFNNWGNALVLGGRPLDAEKVFRRGVEISRAGQTEEAVSPMLLVNYARSLHELQRLGEAADYAERGYSKAQQAGAQAVVSQSLLLRALIYKDQGRLPDAAAMLAEVEPRLGRSLPAGHIAFATFASDRALIAEARGDLQAALNLSGEAIAIAEAASKARRIGGDYLPTFLTRRSDVHLQLHRPQEAAEDATRAVSLLEAAARPRTFSSTLGRAYLALGRALLAQGKRDEAHTAFRSAVEHLQSALGSDHPDTRSARQLAGLDIQPQ
jgi:non-specific serine/threonine protein kinase/serine/threonine-protein kinase